MCVTMSSYLYPTHTIILTSAVLHATRTSLSGGWVGAVCTFWYERPLVVSACESLHVRTVCIWCCEHARFCVEVFYALYINFHLFIHSSHIVQELCESRGGRPGLSVLMSLLCFCGRKATNTSTNSDIYSEFKSCVKVEVAALGSPS